MPSEAPAHAPGAGELFVAHHGQDAFNVIMPQLDLFLTEHRLVALEDTLASAPIVASLLGQSRRQFKGAIEGVRDGEPVWMIFTYNPAGGPKRRDSFDVRAVVGPYGRVTVSFEETLGGGSK